MSMKASLRQIKSYQTTDPNPPTLTLDLHPTKLNPNPNLTITPSFGGAEMFWDNLNRLLGLGLQGFQ